MANNNNEVEMSREERLDLFKNNIFEKLFKLELNKEDYSYLKNVLPFYIKLKMNLENVEIVFDTLNDYSNAYLSFDENKVNINVNSFLVDNNKNEIYKNFANIIKLVKATSHELAHFIDKSYDKEHDTKRFYIGRRMYRLSELTKVYPEKKDFYDETSIALYLADRAEVFARQLSAIESKSFLKEVKEYKEKNFPLTSQVKKEYEEYLSYLEKIKNDKYEEFPALSTETAQFIIANSKIKVLENTLENDNNYDKEDLNWAMVKKNNNIQEVKKDINEVVNKYLEPNNFDEKYTNVDIDKFASLMEIPEFFDQNTVQKLFEYYKNNSSEILCGVLCKISNFEISPKEREKYIKIMDDKMKIHYENKLKQKNEETFQLD